MVAAIDDGPLWSDNGRSRRLFGARPTRQSRITERGICQLEHRSCRLPEKVLQLCPLQLYFCLSDLPRLFMV